MDDVMAHLFTQQTMRGLGGGASKSPWYNEFGPGMMATQGAFDKYLPFQYSMLSGKIPGLSKVVNQRW